MTLSHRSLASLFLLLALACGGEGPLSGSDASVEGARPDAGGSDSGSAGADAASRADAGPHADAGSRPVPQDFPQPEDGADCAAVWVDDPADFGLTARTFSATSCSSFRRNATETWFGRGHRVVLSPTFVPLSEGRIEIWVERLEPGLYDGAEGARSDVVYWHARTLRLSHQHAAAFPWVRIEGASEGWVWGRFSGAPCNRNQNRCVPIEGRFSARVR